MERRLLVPLDGSAQSWDALDYALGTFESDEIVCLHVIEPSRELLEGTVFGDQEHHRRARDQAERIIEESAEILETFETDHEGEIVQGKPAREIVSYAESADIDEIVMGSHGRSGLSRIILGSVAETVVRRAHVPVTIIR